MGGSSRLLGRLVEVETVNFALTNLIPRALVTRLVARVSRAAMRAWTACAGDLALHEADTTEFPSVHACFTRALRPGARPIDANPAVAVSPSDGIVGACGRIENGRLYQVKGRPYSLDELLVDPSLASLHRDGSYATLRLTSTMYHRFHAPDACTLDEARFVPGSTWNVNPPTLARVDRVFCRNERAVLPLRLDDGDVLTLVPVAAILVSSLRVHCIESALDRRYRGPSRIACAARFRRGEEMGYFEHGSTIVVCGTSAMALAEGVEPGRVIRMGEPLLTRR
jgi:phosphatidylserine decarboxylase